MNPWPSWRDPVRRIGSAGTAVVAAWAAGRRAGARRRRRTRWLIFWALAGALAPAGRWLGVGRLAAAVRR